MSLSCGFAANSTIPEQHECRRWSAADGFSQVWKARIVPLAG
jgi:hypothetical protein